MYDDTAEKETHMELSEWIKKTKRVFEFPRHLMCLDNRKTKKRLFISSFHNMYSNL